MPVDSELAMLLEDRRLSDLDLLSPHWAGLDCLIFGEWDLADSYGKIVSAVKFWCAEGLGQP